MNVYELYRSTNNHADKIDSLKIIILRDQFSFLAFLFGPVWLLAKGHWKEFCLLAFVLSALIIILVASGYAAISLPLVIAAHLIIGFEATNLAGRKLQDKGFDLRAIMLAPDADVAFTRAELEDYDPLHHRNFKPIVEETSPPDLASRIPLGSFPVKGAS